MIVDQIYRVARVVVTCPNGRRFSGRHVALLKIVLPEHELRNRLAKQLGGAAEAKVPYGRVDVLTAATAFEVKPWRNWRSAVRQVLSYSAQTGCEPAVALFGRALSADVLRIYIRLRDSDPPVALWWWGACGWVQIRSRRECMGKPEFRWGEEPECSWATTS